MQRMLKAKEFISYFQLFFSFSLKFFMTLKTLSDFQGSKLLLRTKQLKKKFFFFFSGLEVLLVIVLLIMDLFEENVFVKVILGSQFRIARTDK